MSAHSSLIWKCFPIFDRRCQCSLRLWLDGYFPVKFIWQPLNNYLLHEFWMEIWVFSGYALFASSDRLPSTDTVCASLASVKAIITSLSSGQLCPLTWYSTWDSPTQHGINQQHAITYVFFKLETALVSTYSTFSGLCTCWFTECVFWHRADCTCAGNNAFEARNVITWRHCSSIDPLLIYNGHLVLQGSKNLRIYADLRLDAIWSKIRVSDKFPSRVSSAWNHSITPFTALISLCPTRPGLSCSLQLESFHKAEPLLLAKNIDAWLLKEQLFGCKDVTLILFTAWFACIGAETASPGDYSKINH